VNVSCRTLHFQNKNNRIKLVKKLCKSTLAAMVLGALVACDSSSIISGSGGQDSGTPATEFANSPAVDNIVETAKANGSFNTLAAALEATGLDATLANDDGTFTVFAPTDEAFAALGEDTITALLADTDRLSNILLYHVISGSAVDADTAISLAGSMVDAANGEALDITLEAEALFINDSQVTTANVNATNGIIHVIDKVLLPAAEQPTEPTAPLANIVDTAVAAGSFGTLVAALQATELDAVLADESQTFTVFAPTDDAFNLLGSDTINSLLEDTETLSDILLYHVLSGTAVDSTTAISLDGSMVDAANGDALNIEVRDGDLFINDSQVITADIATSNGIIHVIDAVLTPPADEAPVEPGTIVDTAVAAGSFTTLVAALQATGLDSVLADPSSRFTVFAPTDEAFAALGQDTIDALLNDVDTLSNILQYHVIGGTAVNAETAIGLAGTKITAVNDDEFALSLNDGNLFVNTSQVVATDVIASNGIIHVIDSVLMPPAIVETHGTVVDLALADGRFTTLVAALQTTGLDTVLADHDGIFTVFAPTDEAFAMLGEKTINSLLNDPDTLSNILLTHVITGTNVDSVTAFSLSGGSVETASGTNVNLSIRDGSLFINNARVVQTDIKAENGIIHVLDAVIQ
jgi:uncharacterized surface protein with fasciclin (FAS1) repeats